MADALAPSTTAVSPEAGHGRAGSWPLALGSVGVVYGDIVTSPLYVLKESLAAAAAGGALTASPRQPERTSAALRQR
jgi:KUP system potassium uptake protein